MSGTPTDKPKYAEYALPKPEAYALEMKQKLAKLVFEKRLEQYFEIDAEPVRLEGNCGGPITKEILDEYGHKFESSVGRPPQFERPNVDEWKDSDEVVKYSYQNLLKTIIDQRESRAVAKLKKAMEENPDP